ncbi:hypothetical protein BG000_002891 [Podila horticola]|nr:hypothetical protein BG000_002891 [Podila horticola]
MASPEYSDRQKFKSKDGTSLASVLSHLCTATDKRYLLWSDIQRTYQGIDHLETEGEKRILFTIDANGELWQPLRIQHDPDNTLIVIYSNNRRQQAEKSFNILQDSVDHAQGDCQNRAHGEIRPSLEDLFDTCKHLYRHLNATADNRIDDFRQAAANVRYFHSMFVEDAERFGKARVNTLVDGKDQKKMLKVLCDLEQQVPELTYRNTCRSMLYERNSAPEDMPQHVHLSDHPGYRLRQPEEFFQLFGDYVLRMLRMIKHGYSDSVYEIPPLDTFKILWNFNSDTVGNNLSKDTLESLIDRAIAYLQELSSPNAMQ